MTDLRTPDESSADRQPEAVTDGPPSVDRLTRFQLDVLVALHRTGVSEVDVKRWLDGRYTHDVDADRLRANLEALRARELVEPVDEGYRPTDTATYLLRRRAQQYAFAFDVRQDGNGGNGGTTVDVDADSSGSA